MFARLLSSPVVSVLIKSAGIDFGIQGACFLAAAALKTEKFYDLAGSATYLYLTYKSFGWGAGSNRQKLQSACVGTWAVRLGFYLFTRVLREGHDSRFDKVRGNPSLFAIYWAMQGVWVFVTLLPTLIANSKKKDVPLGHWSDYVGYGLWAVGFFFEAVADYQKSAFKQDPSNAGKFIQTGLWSLSRYPNYFGEILMWVGMFLTAAPALEGAEFASIISPLFVVFLLTKVSGIPIQERQALKRWGADPAYQAYLRSTPLLVPRPLGSWL